jgi:hypothetical protein
MNSSEEVILTKLVTPGFMSDDVKEDSMNVKKDTCTSDSAEAETNFEFKSAIFFDSVKVQFHMGQFLWQLIVHMCFPFFLWSRPIAHQFYPVYGNFQQFFFNFIVPSLVFILIIANLMSPNIDDVIWTVPFLFYTIHRFMISFKYGCMSPTEYNKMMNCTDLSTVLKVSSKFNP